MGLGQDALSGKGLLFGGCTRLHLAHVLQAGHDLGLQRHSLGSAIDYQAHRFRLRSVRVGMAYQAQGDGTVGRQIGRESSRNRKQPSEFTRLQLGLGLGLLDQFDFDATRLVDVVYQGLGRLAVIQIHRRQRHGSNLVRAAGA